MIKNFKVSQSLMKDWDMFINGKLCGNIIRAKYITKEWDRKWFDSPAKKLGRYFEYLVTGANPTGYNEAPKPEYMKSAINKASKNSDYKLSVSDMLDAYRLAHSRAELTKDLLKKSGIVIQSAQVQKTKGNLEGNVDVEAVYKHEGKSENITIDIKYSGLIYDKWNPLGWMWTNDQKYLHGKQARQYEILTGNPTYFLIVSSDKSDSSIKLFKVNNDKFSLEQHQLHADKLIENIEYVESIGWNNYPELEKCRKCPILNKCKDRCDTLIPEEIEINFFNE